jgi:tetratricopeptide (TPR) repeat protein
VISQRVARLSKPAGTVLSVAAIAGPTCSFVLLEHVLDDEPALLEALEEAVAAGLLTEAGHGEYAFAHALVRQTIYEGLGAARRMRLHRHVGEALESLTGARAPEALAHHFAEAAADGQGAKAATYALAAGRSATARLGYEEAIGHFERGLQALAASGGQRNDEQRCELLLALAETRWSAGQIDIAEEACRQAVDLAERLGHPTLRAQSMVIVGRLCSVRGKLADARTVMERARVIAHDAGDALAEFGALVNLGYVSNTADSLETGVALLRAADRLYHERLASGADVDDAELRRMFRRLQGYIAIAEFDAWRFGAATRRLESCVAEMGRLAMRDDLARTLAVLGQLRIATGCFEDARAALSDGIALFSHRRGDVALRAYNRSLLGKLYLEWDRPEDARAPLADALREVQGAGHEEFALSVRLYLAELLIRDGDHDAAAAHLDAVVEIATGAGYPNMLTNARSLFAEIALARGDYDSASRASHSAVTALEVGALVLVRSEEVFLRHAHISRIVGDEAAARDYARRALAVVRKKEASIDKPEVRERFLSRVPINRAVLRIAHEHQLLETT